jgi:hypothetical protein
LVRNGFDCEISRVFILLCATPRRDRTPPPMPP